MRLARPLRAADELALELLRSHCWHDDNAGTWISPDGRPWRKRDRLEGMVREAKRHRGATIHTQATTVARGRCTPAP